MSANRHSHPEEEVLEKYAMGATAGINTTEIEEHLLVCTSCQERFKENRCFIEAIRGLYGSSMNRPIDFTHVTSLGPIRLVVQKPAGRSQWAALFSGQEMEGGRRFGTVREANAFVLRCFSELFPEHQCSGLCGPTQSSRSRSQAGRN